MGFLVSFTLLIAMNANLLLLPSLLLSFDRRATTKALKHESLLPILDEVEANKGDDVVNENDQTQL